MAVAAHSFPAPVQFGKYWLDAELAVGGMARLYRARLRGPGGFEKKLVLKQILPHLSKQPSFIELLVREANTLVQLSHPNIVPIYELGVVDGVYFLAMELVEGATVAELLRGGPLPPELCAEIAVQVCEALQYAHAGFGLVHRDVTPRNVIIDGHGHVKLLDFGIAAPLEATGRGEFFGSPGYMSPEQTRGELLTGRSDLFSLGRVLGEALTGVLDAEGAHPAATASEPLGPIGALVAALTQPDPLRRPSSAAAVALQLRTWLAQAHPAGVASRLAERVAHARIPFTTEGASHAVVTEPLAEHGGATQSLATRHGFPELSAALATAPPTSAMPRNRKPGRDWRMGSALLVALAAAAAVALHFHLRGDARAALDPRGAAQNAPAWPEVPRASAARALAATSAVPTDSRSLASNPQPTRAVASHREPRAERTHAVEASGSDSKTDRSRTRGLGIAGQTARAPVSATREGDASMTINAVPWAYVEVDDRALGATPHRGVTLRPGHHIVTLKCPPLGRSTSVPLDAVKGAHYQLWVDLIAVPARVTLE